MLKYHECKKDGKNYNHYLRSITEKYNVKCNKFQALRHSFCATVVLTPVHLTIAVDEDIRAVECNILHCINDI